MKNLMKFTAVVISIAAMLLSVKLVLDIFSTRMKKYYPVEK